MNDLLSLTLQLVVPLRVLVLEDKGGPAPSDWAWVESYRDSGELAHGGDELLYRGRKPGHTARKFNDLARAISILAFAPGGIRFAGIRFEPGPGCGRADVPGGRLAEAPSTPEVP